MGHVLFPRHFLHSRCTKLFAAAFLLALSCTPLFAVEEIDSAAFFNANLAPSLLGAANACGAPGREASMDDPFSVSDARIVALIPQAGNVSSDLSNASLLWSWSASYPQEAVFALSPNGNCRAGEYRVSGPSKAEFMGALRYNYGSEYADVRLQSGGPSPVPLDLDRTHLREDDFTIAPRAFLHANLSGTMSVMYTFSRTDYVYGCHSVEGGEMCGCEARHSSGTRTYEKHLSDSKTFEIETGPVGEFWANPPLQNRLAGSQSGQVVFLARRMPSMITAHSGGTRLGWNSPYSFNATEGSCGEKEVSAVLSPEGDTMDANVSAIPATPFQLTEKNYSCYPVYAEFGWNETQGKKGITLQYEDWFSHRMNFTREFSVRAPEPFNSSAEGGEALVYRQGNDGITPAAYPVAPPPGKLPDFSGLALLAALPFALGAYGLLRLFAAAGGQ
ncbi:Uncharacterised protein [uncultured archaeon]|nr:Uncharacterised protein [uncultured archaeon]